MRKALIGTAKGLVVLTINGYPQLHSIHFKGFSITMVHADERIGRWWCGVSHKHWGQKLHYSDDCGISWKEARVPNFGDVKLANGQPAKLRQLWCMAHANEDRPGELWLGTDPGGLFHSTDNGESFSLVHTLWDHPSRSDPMKWFGAGSDYPFIHSIVVDPNDSDRVYIAVSCAGVFETVDGGKTWEARNRGLIAAYLPNPHVEIGHDPHMLLQHPAETNVLWQQNHCGVFLSKDYGATWNDVSGEGGMPNYGFAIAIDDRQPGSAWVIPVESDEERVAPDLKLEVYQTHDFGRHWESVSEGLPEAPAFDIVLRQAFVKKGDFMLFGTTNGNIYYSRGKNIHWKIFTANLTKVNTVIIAEN